MILVILRTEYQLVLNLFRLPDKEFFIDNAEEKIHMVKNNIRHIIVIEKTVVFILLLI